MKISNQQEVWNNIAEEWHEFKTNPSENAQKFLKNKKGNILDLGSGSGRNLLGLKSKAEFYLVDFSEKMIKLAKERLQKENISAEFLVSDLTKLPYEDNFFDYAICVAALHCIETEKKRKKVVEELYRIMKPKSQVEVEVWNKDSERYKKSPKEKFVAWRDKGKRYYYLYDKEEIFKLFKEVGFKIKKELEHRVNICFIAEK